MFKPRQRKFCSTWFCQDALKQVPRLPPSNSKSDEPESSGFGLNGIYTVRLLRLHEVRAVKNTARRRFVLCNDLCNDFTHAIPVFCNHRLYLCKQCIRNYAGTESAHIIENRTIFKIPDKVGNIFKVCGLFINKNFQVGGTRVDSASEGWKIRTVVNHVNAWKSASYFFSNEHESTIA